MTTEFVDKEYYSSKSKHFASNVSVEGIESWLAHIQYNDIWQVQNRVIPFAIFVLRQTGVRKDLSSYIARAYVKPNHFYDLGKVQVSQSKYSETVLLLTRSHGWSGVSALGEVRRMACCKCRRPLVICGSNYECVFHGRAYCNGLTECSNRVHRYVTCTIHPFLLDGTVISDSK